MAIRRLNTTVQPMNDKLSALVSADLSSSIYCLFLGGIVATGALSSATFYIPATIGIVNDMILIGLAKCLLIGGFSRLSIYVLCKPGKILCLIRLMKLENTQYTEETVFEGIIPSIITKESIFL